MKATPIPPSDWNKPAPDDRLRVGEYTGQGDAKHFRHWRPPKPDAVRPRIKPVPKGERTKERVNELAGTRRQELKIRGIVEARREIAKRVQTAEEIFDELKRDQAAIEARNARIAELSRRYCTGGE